MNERIDRRLSSNKTRQYGNTFIPRRAYFPTDNTCILYHAYWGGDTLDRSGNNNHGTTYGTTWVMNGFYFPGESTNSYVSVTPHPSLYPGTGDFASYTWFKPEGDTLRTMYIVADINPVLHFICTHLYTNDMAYNHFRNGSDNISYYRTYDGLDQPIFADGEWALFGYEIDRDVGAYLTKNGVVIVGPAGDLDTTTNILGRFAVEIGRANTPVIVNPGEWFVGTIFETYTFNTILTQSERNNMFNFNRGKFGL